ncbi:O-antigen ligase family protein [Candidatus Daviesbacteria bacterium]|nr:O-antigen ligase family protein [Candidatus Daviesbacteria bacterium]
MLKIKKAEDTLLFLTLLFLPTQLGKHFWPSFSYIYSLKIDYLSPVIYFWDILAAGLLAVWFLQKPKINKLALNLLLVFLFTQALSLIGAGNIGAGLVRLEQYILAGFFGVYLSSLDFKSLAQKIFLPLALGILGQALIAILQFLKGSTIGFWFLGERTFSITTPGIAKFDFYGNQFLRPYATFPLPNVLAGYLVVMVYGLWFMVYRQKRLLKAVSILAAVIIFLTMSRVAILAGMVAVLVMLRRQSIKIIILITIITIILSPILFIRFSAIFNFDSLTLTRREELIGSAWQIFLKKPFFGVGLNNFIPVSAGDLLTGPSRFLQPVHNILLLELAETGIIGLMGLLGLIGYPVLKRSKFKIQNSKLLWVIILFLGMFDHYFLTLPQGYRLLFLIWGLSFSSSAKTA